MKKHITIIMSLLMITTSGTVSGYDALRPQAVVCKKHVEFDNSLFEDVLRNISTDRQNVFVYEYPGYQIAELCGFSVPDHIFINSDAFVDNDILDKFKTDEIFIKVIADGLAHKSKQGGVLRLKTATKAKRKKSLKELLQFFQQWKSVKGFKGLLLCEKVDVDDEFIMGAFLDIQFGPVMTFGSGGTDVESKNDKAFMLIPENPASVQARLEFRSLIESTKAGKALNDVGMNKLLDVMQKTAAMFTGVYTARNLIVTELDINPFGFTKDNEIKAMDFLMALEPRVQTPNDEGKMSYFQGINDFASRDTSTVEPVFNPKKIGVLGNPESPITQGFCAQFQNSPAFETKPENVILIKEDDLSNPSVVSDMDLVMVVVKANGSDIIEKMKTIAETKSKYSKGNLTFCVISGGFKEAGEDKLQQRLEDIVSRHKKIRIFGPNCLGLVRTGKDEGFCGLLVPLDRVKMPDLKNAGDTYIFAQSGGFIVNNFELNPDLSPAGAVSYGNAIDIGPVDLLNYVIENKPEKLKKVIFYLEGLRPGEGRALYESIKKAKAKDIDVFFYYGVSESKEAQQAAFTHTASMASGETGLLPSVLRSAGAIEMTKRVSRELPFGTYDDLVRNLKIRHGEYIRASFKSGRKTGIALAASAGISKVTSYEGMRSPCFIEYAELSETTVTALERLRLPTTCTIDNPFDFTGAGKLKHYKEIIESFLIDPQIKGLVISITPAVPCFAEIMGSNTLKENSFFKWLAETINNSGKPVIVSIPSSKDAEVWGYVFDYFRDNNIPCVYYASQGVEALRRLVNLVVMEDVRYVIIPQIEELAVYLSRKTRKKITSTDLVERYIIELSQKNITDMSDDMRILKGIIGFGCNRILHQDQRPLPTGLDPLNRNHAMLVLNQLKESNNKLWLKAETIETRVIPAIEKLAEDLGVDAERFFAGSIPHICSSTEKMAMLRNAIRYGTAIINAKGQKPVATGVLPEDLPNLMLILKILQHKTRSSDVAAKNALNLIAESA